jgi:ferric-dicitrate binding protein FerR (iron transport regulator)
MLRLVLCFYVLLLSLCTGACGKSTTLAELQSTSGKVDRDRASAVEAWSVAASGDTFQLGDGLKTGPSSSAQLSLQDGSQLRVQPETIVRFRLQGPPGGGTPLSLELGEISLKTPTSGRFSAAFGTAILGAASEVVIRRQGDEYRFRVLVGTARLERADGAVTITSGQSVVVGIGRIAFEPREASPPAGAAPPPTLATSAAPPAVQDTALISVTAETAGVKVRPAKATAWQPLEEGPHWLPPASELRLLGDSRVSIARGSERVQLRGSGQYVLGRPGTPLVTATSGKASVETSDGPVAIAVPGGVIVAKAASRSSIDVRRDGTTAVIAERGSLEVKTARATELVNAGESLVIAKTGAMQLAGRSLDYADLVLTAGESCVVHDPSPPTALGFAIPTSCVGGAVLRLSNSDAKNGIRGSEQINVAVTGSVKYRIHCVTPDGVAERAEAEGAVSVITDAGTRRISTTAPSNVVDADGRHYTLLYQNALPQVVIRWASAPNAPLQLEHVHRGKSVLHPAPGKSFVFKSGALAEGTHTLSFSSAGAERSAATTVEVRFDNAAPTASITSPTDRAFGPGAEVTVSGMALPGWHVTVSGRELVQDSQYRFSGQASAPARTRALAVRFTNPQRGVHYYLRRSTGDRS